jgi:hypothetical protein
MMDKTSSQIHTRDHLPALILFRCIKIQDVYHTRDLNFSMPETDMCAVALGYHMLIHYHSILSARSQCNKCNRIDFSPTASRLGVVHLISGSPIQSAS